MRLFLRKSVPLHHIVVNIIHSVKLKQGAACFGVVTRKQMRLPFFLSIAEPRWSVIRQASYQGHTRRKPDFCFSPRL